MILNSYIKYPKKPLSRAEYLFFSLLALFYVGFLTNGLPFFWCDFDLFKLSLGININSTHIFSAGDIPIFITKAISKICGIDINIFRLLKDTVVIIYSNLAIYFTYRLVESKLTSFLVGTLILTNATVLKSTIWVSDFEILTQVFIIAAFIFYLKNTEVFKLKYYVLSVIFYLLATQTTNGARIFPMVVAADLLITKNENIKERFILFITLLLICLLGKNNPVNTSHYLFSLQNIKEQLFYLLKMGGCFIFPTFVMAIFCFSKVKNRVIRLISVWLVFSFLQSLFYQKTDFQFPFEVNLIGPAYICLFSYCYIYLNQVYIRKIIKVACLIMLVSWLLLNNFLSSNHYRGAWGSLFIGFDKVVRYIDCHYINSLVIYQSPTPNLMSFSSKNKYSNMYNAKNEVDLKKQISSEMSKLSYKNVFLVYHNPSSSVPIDGLSAKSKIISLEGKTNYLYDKIKESFRLKTKSKDKLNQFLIYRYEG